MTEDQIERTVERWTDSIDKRFMAGAMSQAEYDAELLEVTRWAQTQYSAS